MANVTIAHHPELTAEHAMEVFSRHLADKYDVHRSGWIEGGDFVVRKSRWVAVGVQLNQKADTTSFAFDGNEPAIAYLGAVAAVVGLVVTLGITWVLLRKSWKAIEADITLCIKNATEFR